ncbi:hypothetical protein ACH4U5_31875 [Streptomyces sp. NPDC020858]|uniref:hypothetical protein n=1 Tax=Streptomyces sp. NPDC020858 TaxID=3365097 RepID=UPI0037A07846
MTKISTPLHPDERRRWLPVAALFTVVAPVAVWLGQATSYLPSVWPPFTWAYVVPLAMVAATWIPPRTDVQLRRRRALGGIGCVLAFLYPHMLLVAVLVLWGFSGS